MLNYHILDYHIYDYHIFDKSLVRRKKYPYLLQPIMKKYLKQVIRILYLSVRFFTAKRVMAEASALIIPLVALSCRYSPWCSPSPEDSDTINS